MARRNSTKCSEQHYDLFQDWRRRLREAAREADQVLRLRLVNNRLIPTCLETRAILAEPSVDGS